MAGLAASSSALAVNPQPDAGGISRNVVIARNILPVPPASLDALRAVLDLEHALVTRPIAAFQALRLQGAAPSRGDRVRLLIVFILAIIIWLAAIPISWLLLIRFYPS